MRPLALGALGALGGLLLLVGAPGHFLVRLVPEPSTVLLLASGLAALAVGRRRRTPIVLVLAATTLGSVPVGAVTIHDVDFTGLVRIDVDAGTNLQLSTTEDVYVFAPGGVVASILDISAMSIFVDEVSVQTDLALFCTDACATVPFELKDDVLLTLLDPVGDLVIRAGGSVVLSAMPIPEPSTAVCVALGLAGFGVWRHRA